MLLSKDEGDLLIQLINDELLSSEHQFIEWKYDLENCVSDEPLSVIEAQVARWKSKVEDLKQLKKNVINELNNGH